MMRPKFTRVGVAIAALICYAGLASTASATVLTFELDTEFSGAFEPLGPSPWLTATFDDGDTPGTVLLTMEATNLTGSEFASIWSFNVDPIIDPSTIVITADDISALGGAPTFTKGTDCCKADGDGFFDVKFDFDSGDFTAGESVSYLFTLAGLTANSFDYLSAGGGNSENGLYTAAHVQGIGSEGQNSGWITGSPVREPNQLVPEPGSLMLFGTGLVVLGWAGGRRRRTEEN